MCQNVVVELIYELKETRSVGQSDSVLSIKELRALLSDHPSLVGNATNEITIDQIFMFISEH